jgi:hypothetical protein
MNENLKAAIEEVFKPLGIIGYSGCCRLGCTGAYDEWDREFRLRDEGIVYFKLFLSGMNYQQHPQAAFVQYSSLESLNRNWASEKALIDRWCGLLGLNNNEYDIERPKTEDTSITIRFARPLDLDPVPDDDDDTDDTSSQMQIQDTT